MFDLLHRPDVIMLQGIKAEMEEEVTNTLAQWYHISSGRKDATKKTSWLLTLLRRSLATKLDELSSSPHKASHNRPDMLVARAKIAGHQFSFINVHMDCGSDPEDVKVRQQQVIEFTKLADKEAESGVVIGGGNTNVRDREDFFDDADNLKDAWLLTGDRDDDNDDDGWTWDLFRNDYLTMNTPVGHRFDRLFSVDGMGLTVSPDRFERLGTEKVLLRPGGDVLTFLSDHFGIFAAFEVEQAAGV